MTHIMSRSAFEAAAKRAHSGRVNPSMGAVGKTSGGGNVTSGSQADSTGGLTQKPRRGTRVLARDNSGS